jgi:hypothetical protein
LITSFSNFLIKEKQNTLHIELTITPVAISAVDQDALNAELKYELIG